MDSFKSEEDLSKLEMVPTKPMEILNKWPGDIRVQMVEKGIFTFRNGIGSGDLQFSHINRHSNMSNQQWGELFRMKISPAIGEICAF